MNKRMLVIENGLLEITATEVQEDHSVKIGIRHDNGHKLEICLYGEDLRVLADELKMLSDNSPF